MDFLNRRSIRKYSTQTIEKEKIQEIMKTAVLSPSGHNGRPYEFIVIDNKDLIKKLAFSKVSGGQFAVEAPLMILVLGKKDSYPTMEDDCAIASTIIQLKAHDLGLGSCWIQIKNKVNEEGTSTIEIIRNLLSIPDLYHINNLISLGYPAEERKAYEDKDANMELVHYNKF